jgi:multidrug efflux system membrane fusion protein
VWLAAAQGAPQRGPAVPPEVPVATAQVTQGDVGVYLSGLGAVTPEATVTIRTRVDGELVEVGFEEGEIVEQSQLLALIDPRPFEAQLELAKGQLARDEAALANARVDLKRYATLTRQDSITRQQYDTQVSLVRQQEGTVAADRGNVANAEVQLAYTRITAPVGGRAGLRLVDPGNIVHATDTTGLVVVTQLQPIAVIFSIAEDNVPSVLSRLRRGETLEVDAFDRAGTQLIASGSLLTTDNLVDAATGTVRLKARFGNEDLRLFPGQFVNARLLLETQRDRPLVPAAAMQRGAAAPFVYVVKPDHTVDARTVAPGPSEGDHIAVERGVKPGEWVVVDGADRVRQGSRVSVRGLPDGGFPDAGIIDAGVSPDGTTRERPP